MNLHNAVKGDIMDFPSYWSAPRRLLLLDGNCGVVAAWGVLKYFHKRASSERLIRSCRYTKKYGAFAIALAVALKEHGLSVVFYSEPDPEPKPIERRCYRIAEKMGIPMNPALDLEDILAQIGPRAIPIVLYNTDQGNGHFSPIVGHANGRIHLPYAEEESKQIMSKEDFISRWTAPEIYRQCLIVSRIGRTKTSGADDANGRHLGPPNGVRRIEYRNPS